MKQLTQYINEKLHVGKVNTKKPNPKYFPETREELDNLLHKLFEERGYDADLNDIDVSKIDDMSNLFDNDKFDNKLKNFSVKWWDVSNVFDMEKMFAGCKFFDCDLSEWDVSNVNNFARTFYYCKNFKGFGLDKWNVTKGEYFTSMFNHCDKFDCDLSSWNLKNAKTTASMFADCHIFIGKGLENWDISNNTSIFKMFINCYKLRVNLDNWDISKIEYKSNKVQVFDKCSNMKKLPSWYEKNDY